MSEPKAVITQKGVDRIRAGHLWIYRSDVMKCDGDAGSIVSVQDQRGKKLGKAFYSSNSQITLRFLSTRDEAVDEKFFRRRLEMAWNLRKKVVSNTEVYRLVHGEGDGLPAVIIDRYQDVFVLQTLSQGSDQIKPVLVRILQDLFSPAAILERNDSRVRELEGLPQSVSVLAGSDPGEMVCLENGLQFLFSPMHGQKTGGFLDQRENRVCARQLAFGKALDCFCYAGSFAVHIAEVCEEVEAIDMSAEAIELARRNAGLNGLANLHFEAENVFDRLRLYDNLKKKFDTIILDPPAFAKNRSHISSALRGYKEINLRALRLLNPGGLLITASCSQLIEETMLLNLLVEAASDTGRTLQLIEKRTQARDHPILLSMPETYYLKCFFVRVLA